MKKNLALLSAAVLLAACGKNANEPAVTAPVQAPTPAAVSQAAPPAVKTCNIETAAAQAFKPEAPVVSGAKVRFTGWAIDTQDHGVPKTAILRLTSGDGAVTREAPIVMWRARPDVAGANANDQAYLESGFSVDVPTEGLAAGSYAVTVRYSDSRTCDVGRHVTVQ